MANHKQRRRAATASDVQISFFSEEKRHRVGWGLPLPAWPAAPVCFSTSALRGTQLPHLLHLLLERGEDLVALGQSRLKLFELLRVQRQLENNTTQV